MDYEKVVGKIDHKSFHTLPFYTYRPAQGAFLKRLIELMD
jgi:hypothetical protein